MYQESYSQGGGPNFGLPSLTFAVKRLLILNVAVFLLFAVLLAFVQGSTLMTFFGLSPGNFLDGYGLGLLRFLSYQFVHAFNDPFHLIMNMLVLFFFGTMVEQVVGSKGLVRLYLLSGFLGGLLQLFFAWAMDHGDVPTVGASGACYGIMVYAACLQPKARVWFILIPIQLAWLAGILVFVGVYMTYAELLKQAADCTAHGAHLGGALWGFLAYRYRQKLMSPVASQSLGGKFARWRAGRIHQAHQREQETMDQLLDKVKKQGMSALTAAERRFMEKVSKKKSRS